MRIDLTHNEEDSDDQSPGGKVASVFSRIFLIVWSLGFMGIPIFGLVNFIMPSALRYIDSLGWKETPCVIERSSVTEDAKKDLYWADVAYRYVFQNQAYTADKIESGQGKITDESSSKLRTIVKSYPVGMKTVCYVNPDAPKQACLARNFPWGLAGAAGFISIFVVIGSLTLLSALGVFRWRRKRREANKNLGRDNPFTNDSFRKKEDTRGEKKDYSKLFLIVFGIFFAGTGGSVLSIGIHDVAMAKSSNTWVETPCVIERSKVKLHSSNDGATYSVSVRYTYEWEGKSFAGDQYDFSSGSDSEYAAKTEAVKRYPAGKKTICYVNPAQPDQAVLARTAGDGLWLMFLVGGLFFVVGLGIICGAFFYRRRIPDPQILRIPALLSVSMNPLREFFLLCFVAVFWNGIVSIFVSVIIRKYLKDGTVEWFLVAFISIFVIVGVIIVLGVIRAFFSMLGSKLALFMTPGVYPGETVSLDWTLAGDAYHVKRVNMTLECLLRIKGGKSTREDVIRRIELLSKKGPLAASRGTVTFTMPEDAEISSTSYYGILWRIKVDIKQNLKPVQKWVFKLTVMNKSDTEK